MAEIASLILRFLNPLWKRVLKGMDPKPVLPAKELEFCLKMIKTSLDKRKWAKASIWAKELSGVSIRGEILKIIWDSEKDPLWMLDRYAAAGGARTFRLVDQAQGAVLAPRPEGMDGRDFSSADSFDGARRLATRGALVALFGFLVGIFVTIFCAYRAFLAFSTHSGSAFPSGLKASVAFMVAALLWGNVISCIRDERRYLAAHSFWKSLPDNVKEDAKNRIRSSQTVPNLSWWTNLIMLLVVLITILGNVTIKAMQWAGEIIALFHWTMLGLGVAIVGLPLAWVCVSRWREGRRLQASSDREARYCLAFSYGGMAFLVISAGFVRTNPVAWVWTGPLVALLIWDVQQRHGYGTHSRATYSSRVPAIFSNDDQHC